MTDEGGWFTRHPPSATAEEAAMSESATNFHKALKILNSDLDVVGWDQPHKFYAIKGDRNDPQFELLCELPLDTHPAEFLQFMHQMSVAGKLDPMPKDSIGLLLVNEGWRHLKLEELEALNAGVVAKMRAAANALGLGEDAVRENYQKAIMLRRPSEMPPQLRREMRTMTAVLRDGTTLGSIQDRDGEFMADDGYDIGGRIPDAMKRFVAGQEPEPTPDRSWNAPVLSELLKRGK